LVELRLLPYPLSAEEVELDQDLLELLTFTTGDSTDIPVTEFILQYQGLWPKNRLELKKQSTSYFIQGDEPTISQEIEGVWGYHEDYDNAWIDSLDAVVDDPLAIGATSITIDSLSGETEDFRTPRFLRGHLLRLKLGDVFEFIEVVDGVEGVDTDPDTITVLRGARGSTAVGWAKDTLIEIWRPDASSELAVQELVRALYFLRQTDYQGIQQVLGTGVVITPQTFPAHVADLLPAPRIEL